MGGASADGGWEEPVRMGDGTNDPSGERQRAPPSPIHQFIQMKTYRILTKAPGVQRWRNGAGEKAQWFRAPI